MKLGMIGLGKMGGNMAERLRRHGHEVVGYDRNPDSADVDSLEALAKALEAEDRRVFWSMVPAGDPTEATIQALAELAREGDLVIDGGNSNFRDSLRRGDLLAGQGIGFVDCGVSGGVWGLSEGYCLMYGGADDDVAYLQPVFTALAQEGGHAHMGPVGTGHFTKMVHNGVEYGLMQAYAEGYELLHAAELDIDVPAAVEVWRHGSVVRSWLLDLLADALRDDPQLDGVRGWANDSGEGRWTVQEAINAAVPAPAISAALFARFASRQEDSTAMKVIAVLRKQFGGHATRG
jgi:6-phosphogluconate dehydrogenase